MSKNLSALMINLALQCHHHLNQVLGTKYLTINSTSPSGSRKSQIENIITSLVFPLNLERTSCGRRWELRSGEGLVSRPSTTRAPNNYHSSGFLIISIINIRLMSLVSLKCFQIVIFYHYQHCLD